MYDRASSTPKRTVTLSEKVAACAARAIEKVGMSPTQNLFANARVVKPRIVLTHGERRSNGVDEASILVSKSIVFDPKLCWEH